MNYWLECILAALDEAGIKATDEQAALIADCVEVAHQNYGMAHGHDVSRGPSPAERELAALKAKIEKEQEWIIMTDPCKACTTTGSVKDSWDRDKKCPECQGKGRVHGYHYR